MKVFTKRNALIVAGILLLAVIGGMAWLVTADIGGLSRWIAETDRRDPGWRMEDLLAAQEADPIPEEEDSASLAEEAVKLIPAGWPGGSQQGEPDPPRGERLLDLIDGLKPGEVLPPEVLAGLKAECEALEPALVKARGIADRPRGRLAVSIPSNPILVDLADVQDLRQVARLLHLDAIRRAAEGDGDGAIRDVRAILNTARSLRDVPVLMAQLIRSALDSVAVNTLERVLGQGTASEAELAKLQALLDAEASEPLGVFALRSERASFNSLMVGWADGRQGVGMPGLHKIPIAGPALVRHYHGGGLEMFSAVMEIAAAPDHEQRALFDELEQEMKGMRPGVRQRSFGTLADLLVPSLRSALEAGLRTRATLNAARVLVALERARLAGGKWPKSVDVLPRAILPEIPEDSFADAPLRVIRLEDGWEVGSAYQVKRPDGSKDPKSEIRLRLFNPERRKFPMEQPATPEGDDGPS